MTKPFEEQRKALIEERDDIAMRLETTHHFGMDTAMNDVVGELSGYDQHPADLGSELFEREKDVAILEHQRTRLEQVERALLRMQEGKYGICDACGIDIEPLRLEAEPAALFCIACQQKKDPTPLRGDRPAEEEFLYPGFGRTNLDGQDATGFDGEDTWQALASFNNRQEQKSELDDDWYFEGDGYVEAVDRISNQEYEAQLPD